MRSTFTYDGTPVLMSLFVLTGSRYTGKERDTESGLDYFGARYYASNMGRWMSPDWSAKEEPVPYAKLDNPQSLNLYQYVGNNPLTGIDGDGHETEDYDLPGLKRSGNQPISKTEVKIWGGVALGAAVASGGAEIVAAGAAIGRGVLALGSAATGWLVSHPEIIQRANEMLQDAAAPPGSSVWNMAPAARGLAIEAQLGGNLPQNFPTIDRFAGGVATSIKSLDLNASSYQSAGTLASTVTGYIDKVASFNGGSLSGATISSGQIVGRQLELAVPGAGSAVQQGVLAAASKYATSRGVQLTIKQVK